MKESTKPSQDSILQEWRTTANEMIKNIEWQWETIRMYLTVMGFLLVAYNYLVYQFAIPYMRNSPADNNLKPVIIFASLLIPILSVPITWYALEIFEYRYRRFLDKAYTMNKLRLMIGIGDKDLKLYPPRYYDSINKGLQNIH
jgi:hypothetical protein